MELRQLRYFVKVAKLSSFSEAAKELCITQSTLSQQIRQLEDELRVSLLDRNSRHVKLSDYGEQFLPYAVQTLKDADASIERIKDVQNLEVGTLTIGSTYTFAPLLRQTVKDYLRKFPGIKLNIIFSSMEEIMRKLENQEIDLALSYRSPEHYESVESHILFNSELCVIASKSNPIAKLSSIRLTELEKYPMALPAKGLQARYTFDSLLFGQNYKFDIRLELNDLGFLLNLVADSSLVTVLSDATINNFDSLTTIPIDNPGCNMEGCYHLLKGSYHKKSSREFMKMLTENNSFNLAMKVFE